VNSASWVRYMDIVWFLINEVGYDVNQLGGNEYFNNLYTVISIGSPLRWTAQGLDGWDEVVRFLLEHEADLHCQCVRRG
jgi:hypothetical protein